MILLATYTEWRRTATTTNTVTYDENSRARALVSFFPVVLFLEKYCQVNIK